MRSAEVNQMLRQLFRQAADRGLDIAADLDSELPGDDGSPVTRCLREYVTEARGAYRVGQPLRPGALASVKQLPLPEVTERDAALAAIDHMLRMLDDPGGSRVAFPSSLSSLAGYLLPRLKAHDTADPLALLARLDAHPRAWSAYGIAGYIPTPQLVRAAARMIAVVGLTPQLRAMAESVRAAGERRADDADRRKAVAVLANLLAEAGTDASPIDATDDWGVPAQAALEALPADRRAGWVRLLSHEATASGTRPGAAWLREARARVEQIGAAEARELIERWLGLLAQRGAGAPAVPVGAFAEVRPAAMIPDANASLLRGLIWTCLCFDDAAMARTVGQATKECFRKIPGFGARSTKAGNAGVYVLGQLHDPECVAQLDRLAQAVKLPSAQKVIDAALAAASERVGLSRADLEELAVPTFGLTDGNVEWRVGEHRVTVAVEGSEVTIHWYDPAGKPLRAEPAAVRSQFAPTVKTVKQTAKEIAAALGVHRGRLESLYLEDRAWSYEDWRARYLDHPLVSLLARRLIWQLRSPTGATTGAWADGCLRDAQDQPLDVDRAACEVRLWHPAWSSPQEVLNWRRWLSKREVRQPFKQAHREIYILTDAERATGAFSNRFAGHVLRQHQFSALCLERGWRYRLQGSFDGWNIPTRALPAFGLEAEYEVDVPERNNQVSQMGLSLFVTTGQVRFRRAGMPVPLPDVPPLAFSEAMRDIDLFVGVCSVGNDLTWAENLPDRYRDYWLGYSVGELELSARTRGEVLQEVLPKLAIADRCTIEGRFLVVRGDLRTYRIHLGSGNILMEPNNQYLCIIPARGGGIETSGSRVFLPFEGDGLLSIILSKAFLLADDASITDPSIVRQLR